MEVTQALAQKTTFIYTLSDPRTPDIIRYVGKADKPNIRYRAHINRVDAPKYDSHKDRWVRKLKTEGLLPVMEVIETVSYCEGAEWADIEIAYIQLYKEEGHPLTNTDGGGSGGGHPMSESTKAKIMEGHKKHNWQPLTEEHKAKVSASLTGKKQSPEHIANNQRKRKGEKRGPMTAEGKANCKLSKQGFVPSQATRDGHTRYWERKRQEKALKELLQHWRI